MIDIISDFINRIAGLFLILFFLTPVVLGIILIIMIGGKIMKTNEIKKGMTVKLRNGWSAVITDNRLNIHSAHPGW